MYTMQRYLVVMIGAALASIAGAQSMPYQPPPDASYQGPVPDAAPAYDNTAPALNDPPGRVARLSYVNGEVSFTPAGEESWVQAQVNRPVVTGDRIWTDADAHAELSLGAATVRLDRSSSFDFLNLDDQLAQMELTQGTLNLNVRRLRGNETYEVDTPTIAFVASRDGDYRINVDPNGGTTVTAWRGSGDAVGEGGRRVTIEEGQAVVFNDSQLSNPQVSLIGTRNQAVPRNDFDTFVSEREQRYTQASHQYVSEDVVGYEDLDQYGTWESAPEYGHVWYPREVAADWAPYHDGHWAWVDPWGWTWVDNAPWGYAPSHYGRWSYVGSRWGWVPGPVNVAPVYAPAFVAFVGGGGVSVGFSVGGPVGWFALGPSDVYFPGYRCGRDYFARVNYSNAYVSHTVVNNYYGGWSNGSLNYSQMHYANRDAPRAMTAMRGDAFVAGQPVAGAAIAVNRETFANARVAPRANLMPTRESLVAGRSRAPAPPVTAINRPVIAANRPAPTAPSFEQRQALLQRNGGQPLTRNQMRTAAAQQPANTRVAAANNVRVVGNNNRGNAVTARAAADAGANRANTAGAAAQTNMRAQTNNGRVAGQTPSRAPEMNRSPEHANAQYQRSAGFAHQGVVPGSERATNAQQGRANGAARDTAQSRENAQTREARTMPPQQGRSEQVNRGNTPQNAQRLNSSTFAHGGGQNNARGSASTTQQREDTAARNTAQQREHTATANAARENTQARSNAMAQQNAREQQNARDRNSRAQANTDANARTEANARASANARAETNARASANARSAESARQSQMAQSRAQEQQRSVAAEQARASSQARAQQQRVQQDRAAEQARASSQARGQQQREQQDRAVAQERARSQQQQQQQQRDVQMQRSQQQQQRAQQPQVAHTPPQQQRSEPVTRSQPQQQAQRAPVQRSEPQPQPQVAHAPPPQQQQRAQPQQHQVARSTPPQQRQPAPKKEKDKDKDTNPGGG